MLPSCKKSAQQLPAHRSTVFRGRNGAGNPCRQRQCLSGIQYIFHKIEDTPQPKQGNGLGAVRLVRQWKSGGSASANGAKAEGLCVGTRENHCSPVPDKKRTPRQEPVAGPDRAGHPRTARIRDPVRDRPRSQVGHTMQAEFFRPRTGPDRHRGVDVATGEPPELFRIRGNQCHVNGFKSGLVHLPEHFPHPSPVRTIRSWPDTPVAIFHIAAEVRPSVP